MNISFKIGTKAEINKVSLFQLCQRSPREIGEAITDVFEELDTACWGGVPKDTRERLEAALRRRGFRNGLADCFDERFAGDLFGWEYINMGVSFQRMWDAYSAMVEFLEGTDAATYDAKFDGPAGGNEWVARCDQQCGGNACGVCDGEDLKLRAERIRGQDIDVDLARVKVIDQDSVALKIRARLEVPPENRFVTREHWKYAIRRAAYRAQHDMDWKTGIAKKTVQLASDACKHRDWACGIDYAEFGLTWRPPPGELLLFMQNMAAELKPWLSLGAWRGFPAAASVRRDAALALWELEPPAGPDEVAARLRDFAAADYVKLVFRSDSAYFGTGAEEVNAKDLVSDMWLARGRDRRATPTSCACWSAQRPARTRCTPRSWASRPGSMRPPSLRSGSGCSPLSAMATCSARPVSAAVRWCPPACWMSRSPWSAARGAWMRPPGRSRRHWSPLARITGKPRAGEWGGHPVYLPCRPGALVISGAADGATCGQEALVGNRV